MTSAIADHLNALRELGARPTTFLNAGAVKPGVTTAERYPELSLPADVLELWRQFDGVKHIDGTTLEQLWLDGSFYFLSEAEAANDYAVCFDLWEFDETFEDYWPKGFYPIATPGDGSRLLINCNLNAPTFGAVYELFHGDGVSKSANSLSDYFLTASAWLAEGATWLDERKCVDRDFEKSSIIARRLNPGCDSWD